MTVTSFEYQLQSAEATWTYARWEQLPDDGNRYEVIDGVLYMSTAPGYQHQFVTSRLTLHVGAPLEADGIALFAHAPIGLIMERCEPVQPDFLLVRVERTAVFAPDGRIRGVPDLIAEILSPSNPEHDLVTKRAAYVRAGVPEYWILRPTTSDILVLTGPDTAIADFTESHLFGATDELVSPTLPIRVSVAALFELPPGVE